MSEDLPIAIHPEFTSDEIASIYSSSLVNVAFINNIIAQSTINDEDKDNLKRNVDHLEALKNRKKMNGNVSLWTTEDFSTHDAAIAAGKAKY